MPPRDTYVGTRGVVVRTVEFSNSLCCAPRLPTRGHSSRASSPPMRADEGSVGPLCRRNPQASDGEYPSIILAITGLPATPDALTPVDTFGYFRHQRIDASPGKQYQSTGIARWVESTSCTTTWERIIDTYTPCTVGATGELAESGLLHAFRSSSYGVVKLDGRAAAEGSSAVSAQIRVLT